MLGRYMSRCVYRQHGCKDVSKEQVCTWVDVGVCVHEDICGKRIYRWHVSKVHVSRHTYKQGACKQQEHRQV